MFSYLQRYMTWMISNMSCTQVKRILQKLTRILEILCFLNLSKRRKLIIQVIWWDYVVCRLLNYAYLLSTCIYAQHNRGTISTLAALHLFECTATIHTKCMYSAPGRHYSILNSDLAKCPQTVCWKEKTSYLERLFSQYDKN